MTDTSAHAGERRAWGWLAHLREGGSTSWQDWDGAGVEGGPALPGAQQLELVRRLNAAGRPSPALVDRALTASAPGRGRPDLELVGAAAPSRFGPPPVDPGELSDDELLRVAAALLADDLVAAGVPAPRRPRVVRPWRTRYRLVGDPWLADPLRSELVARGRPPGGRGSVVLVSGTALDKMLEHAWIARAFSVGAPGWREWLDGLARRNRVAPSVDLLHTARTWSDRVGTDRVRIVLDQKAVPGLVGVRRGLPPPPDLAADAVDVARRVANVLGLLVVPPAREALLRETLLPRLREVTGERLAVPPEHAEWVRRRAERMRDGLLRAGYAVVGDPDLLLPRGSSAAATVPSDAGALALAVRLLLDEDRKGGTTR
ncbi:MAG: hypothetical protein JWO11_2189 [Nocardioides sp.]|nr:hypothetical protein [Nocardioides sp.]